MAKGYLHVEVDSNQMSRKKGDPCGDVVAYERSASSTTVILSDGLGKGIKANIAARMCVSRILELLRQGYSLNKAFTSLVITMERAKGTDMPYAVFTIVRVLNDGVAVALTYEMPPPVLVTNRYAQVLPQRTIAMDSCLAYEANCQLAPGEGIAVVSDGVTQAGLGMGFTYGWTIQGMSRYLTDCLTDGIPVKDTPSCIIQQAASHWKEGLGDDCTAVLASCRKGKVVNILTGPPKDATKDGEVVKKFLMMRGAKIVSGGSTAQMVAKCTGRQLYMEQNPQSMLAPPTYAIEGVDLVTEGAVTLNQVYNVFDEDPSRHDEESGVTQFHELLRSADRINIILGSAVNPANKDISFRQKGILTREVILPFLADKLRQAGKLVVVERV